MVICSPSSHWSVVVLSSPFCTVHFGLQIFQRRFEVQSIQRARYQAVLGNLSQCDWFKSFMRLIPNTPPVREGEGNAFSHIPLYTKEPSFSWYIMVPHRFFLPLLVGSPIYQSLFQILLLQPWICQTRW